MRPGWYPDSSGGKRWWSRETGWTQDVLSRSGVPTIDPGPSPVTPPIAEAPLLTNHTPISAAGRASTKSDQPINPFVSIPLGGGGMLLFAVAFVAAAVITTNLDRILAAGAVANFVIGLVCVIRLWRCSEVDVRRHGRILLGCAGTMSIALFGFVGVGFAIAALRNAHNPQRARRLVCCGWIGTGIAAAVVFAAAFAVLEFGGVS